MKKKEIWIYKRKFILSLINFFFLKKKKKNKIKIKIKTKDFKE